MSALTDLPNVGKVLEKNLIEAGISSPEELRAIGTKEAFIRIKANDSGACIQMLSGLHGAVEGINDKLLSDETKNDLRLFFRSL